MRFGPAASDLVRHGKTASLLTQLPLGLTSLGLATRTAALAQQRYGAGVSSVLDGLDAERTRFSAQHRQTLDLWIFGSGVRSGQFGGSIGGGLFFRHSGQQNRIRLFDRLQAVGL
jgi:hypothetical protein